MVEDDTLPAPDGAGMPTSDRQSNRSLFQALLGGEPLTAEQLAEHAADRIIAKLVALLWDEPERIRQKFADCTTDAVDDGVPKTMLAFKKPAKQIEKFIAQQEAEWKSPEFRSALTTILRNRIEGRTTPFDAVATLLRHQFTPYTAATLQTMGKIDPFAVAESEIPQIPLEELRAGIDDVYRRERDAERAALVSAAVSAHPDAAVDDSAFVAAKTPSGSPKELLFGWPEILDAVGRVDDDATRTLVARLNKETNGPIQVKQGGKATADKAKLIPWWNNLENRFSESEQHAQNRDATVSESYGYGKEGEVVPDIGGHVQKRRGNR